MIWKVEAIFNWMSKVTECDCLFFLSFSPWLVQKTHASLSRHRCVTNTHHDFVVGVFPPLKKFGCFDWVLIGSWRYFPLFWVAIVITLDFMFYDWHSIKKCPYPFQPSKGDFSLRNWPLRIPLTTISDVTVKQNHV